MNQINEIKYEIIPLTEENITLLETIRYDAYNININDFPINNTLHTKELKNNKYLVFGCYLNNQLTGACYVSKNHNSLYIEQLFILKKYQNSNLHLGTNLLLHILNNKEIIEKHFNQKFKYSYLDNSKDTYNFYQSLGYIEKENFMRKKL